MSAEASGLHFRVQQSRPIPLRVALHVRPGELMALVGPSGSGKTTTLRVVAGLHRPQQGSIHCDGVTWLDTAAGIHVSPQQRRIGMVFQDYALFPHLSALDNLVVAMDRGTPAERRARALELLGAVRLQGLEHRRPSELSGGQQQRVAVARALAREPRALLLDEPFSAVDMMTRQRLQRELALLRRDIHIPMLLVTHDLQEATALADRICVLHNGNSLQVDDPEELFRHPHSPQVARLLGGHNVFTGTVEHDPSRSELLRWGSYRLELGRSTGLPHGTEVQWFVPDSDIILHRRGRPSRGERENPVSGTVEDCVELGAQTSVTLRCHGTDMTLRLTVSTHAAHRNDLAPGVEATVSLIAEGIHLMPGER